MRKLITRIGMFLIVVLLLTFCSKDDGILPNSEKATLSFAAVLNDLAEKSTLKQPGDIPECSQDAPAFVEIILSMDGTEVVGSSEEPLRINVNPEPVDSDGDGDEEFFTQESASLELLPGTYSLDYFVVLNADEKIIWVAPMSGSDFSGFVGSALPLEIELGAGVKKYADVEVLCFDDRMVNLYGYLFFDINGTRAIEYCVFGNFCDETGRHFPASFSLDIWKYSGDPQNPQGESLVENLRNETGEYENGDAFADPVCAILPDLSGTDQYYLEITLLDSDLYETQERIIRSGVITDDDVRSMFEGASNTNYYHFREGSCQMGDSPALFADVDLEIIAGDMVSPLAVIPSPDDTERLFVIDQIGKIWVINSEGEKLSQPFLDVSGKMVTLNPGYDERGLLGLAFHPDYEFNGRFFAYYTAPPAPGGPVPGASWDNISRISEYSVSSDPNLADAGSERIVLEINQPQSNHEGGTIAFGPDGYLYISIGDGGGANDVGPGHVPDWYAENEGGNGQDIEENLLGNILRIDVDGAVPYGIPSDNPFVGEIGLDEIYAYGFRNPYRFSFDMEDDHRLFVGDAGQALWEEISIVEKGGNYGWNVKEGTHCFNAANNEEVLPNCPEIDGYGNPITDPVIEMRNHHNPMGGQTLVIVGGYVYRGNDIPEFQGKYIFGSFSKSHTAPTGELFMSTPSGPGLWSFHEIDLAGEPENIGYFLKGFGQDLEGEIYVTVSENIGPTGNTGKVLKLVP